jgi:carboxylate-amine ligase
VARLGQPAPAGPLLKIEFNSSPGPSLGVEKELELVDATTRELRSDATDILGILGKGSPDAEHPKAKHELLEATVEIITGVCDTVAEARADLTATLAEVTAVAAPRGVDLLCSGTHPFSDWADQRISPKERYATLVQEMQWLARRLQIFGIHVHIGVRSPEKAIAIANALATYIPHFLAVSASSPFWMGKDTGLASSRSKVFEALPTAGLPHQLADWDEFETYMTTLVSSKAISSIREVWWDIRPHPVFGTIEFRICDGLPRLREVAAVAALSQCLVSWMDGLVDRGYGLPMPRTWIVRENKWKAARYGMDAEIIVDEDGTLRPVREALEDLVTELTPTARRLDCEAELCSVLALADEGPSYRRQRAIVANGGTLVDVVDAMVTELRTDEAIWPS